MPQLLPILLVLVVTTKSIFTANQAKILSSFGITVKLRNSLFIEMTKEQITEEENERRFKECIKLINSLQPGDIEKLMGKEFIEEFKRIANR